MKPSDDLKKFWDEIQNLCYMSGVIRYPDNNFNDILERYGLSRKCPYCGARHRK